jgi:hypothetical protein
VITLSGCKKQNDDRKEELMFNLTVSDLTSSAEKLQGSDLGRRCQVALSKLKNGVLDTEPILFKASVGLVEPNDEPALFVFTLDEDRDIRGLRIKEQYIDPNGTITTLEEDYPVFVNSLTSVISGHIRFPIQIRDKHQRKDRCLWLEYANRNLDALIRKYLDKRPQDSGDTFTRGVLWKEKEMPPIYISVPDPNRVQVFISIYDRAGNESESIKLLATQTLKLKYIP